MWRWGTESGWSGWYWCNMESIIWIAPFSTRRARRAWLGINVIRVWWVNQWWRWYLEDKVWKWAYWATSKSRSWENIWVGIAGLLCTIYITRCRRAFMVSIESVKLERCLKCCDYWCWRMVEVSAAWIVGEDTAMKSWFRAIGVFEGPVRKKTKKKILYTSDVSHILALRIFSAYISVYVPSGQFTGFNFLN